MSKLNSFLRFVAPLAVLGLGVLIVYAIWVTRPQPKKVPKAALAPQVNVYSSIAKSHQVVLDALGVVKPANLARVQPEVTAKVAKVHPNLVAGGLVKAGEILVELDKSNYQIALTQQKARLVQAKFDLDLEMGRQKVAKKEWELLGKNSNDDEIDRKLALREPHLLAAKAAVRSAQSAVRKAALDLKHTSVEAPFDALVLEKNVEIGQIATPQGVLATVVAVNNFWVQVSLPTADLPFVKLPNLRTGEGGAKVVVLPNTDGQTKPLQGTVVRLLADLSDRGKMARLIVEVADPLGLKDEDRNIGAPLLLEDFVKVQIMGVQLDNVHAISRNALRDENTIWIVRDGKLVILPVDIVWRGKEEVYVRGDLQEQIQVVESRLRKPVEGMHLRIKGSEGLDIKKL